MKVYLISWTKDPIGTCAIAASMCYASEPSRKVVRGCISSGHLSVLEHASFTFRISGVSRSFLAQLTRHRIASYSVRSQRYTDPADNGASDVNWVLPTEYMADGDATTEVERIMQAACNEALKTYNALVNGHNCSNDEARAVLPNATPTAMVVTMNIRSLINFFNLRLCSRASREIREVAKKMKSAILMQCTDLTEEDTAILLKLFVPKCENFSIPFCPEHNGCGRHKSLKELVGGK